jgi:hypothetical protein
MDYEADCLDYEILWEDENTKPHSYVPVGLILSTHPAL